MLIKAAINGGRTRAEHAAVSVTPEEQAADVAACLKAGAGAIHLHVRETSASTSSSSTSSAASTSPSVNAPSGVDESSRQDVCAPSEGVGAPEQDVNQPNHVSQPNFLEQESLYPDDVARTLLAVRAVTRNAVVSTRQALIGVSTGAWILPDAAKRFEAVSAWEVLPDFASVNFSEDGAVELARLLLSRGVDVEAGLSDANSAEVFVESGLALSCLRILLEPQEQQMKAALETVNQIESVLKRGLTRIVSGPRVLLHGTDATVWPMMDEAIQRGYDVRVGLEDTLVMSDGRVARDNVELVLEAVRRIRAAGLEID